MGAALLSALQNSVGGGKATLKDRGDVVLAGTRRVFVHVARKENFPTSVPYVVGTFEREREKEGARHGSRESEEKEEDVKYFDREKKEEGASERERSREREREKRKERGD